MNTPLSTARRARMAVLLAGTLAASNGLAFPPAPPHTVYGTVRDEMGNPLDGRGAEVFLESAGPAQVRTFVGVHSEPGVNYRLSIPLDAAVAPDLYKPSALRPTVPFRVKVKVGSVTYLPIEMTGASQILTRPSETTRLDLTLGEDTDGDGLPDAWERAMIQLLGGNLGLQDIRPGDDSDADGMSNLDEYLAGTYAFDPADGFELSIVDTAVDRPLLEFTAIRGRAYAIFASADMQTWLPVGFTLSTDPANSPLRDGFRATDTRLIRAQVAAPNAGDPAYRFFKLEVR